MNIRHKIYYFLIVTLLLTGCAHDSGRDPASFAHSTNCIESSSGFFRQSNTSTTLEIEPSSIAARFRHTMGDLEQIQSKIPTEDKLLAEMGHPTTEQFFTAMLDQKNGVAQELRGLAQKYEEDSFFHQTLLDAAQKLEISSHKRERMMEKISDVAQKLYRAEDVYEQNHRYYSGEIAALYGEIGELKAAASFKGVENRGAHFEFLSTYFDDLNLPAELREALKRGEDRKDDLMHVIKSHIPEDKFDEGLLRSIVDKEVDLIRNSGHEWIEVKNIKHPLTWDDFQHHGRHEKIAEQADKLNRALKMLGIRDKVKLKQTFLNCVDRLTATQFQQLYGIEIVGCIQ